MWKTKRHAIPTVEIDFDLVMQSRTGVPLGLGDIERNAFDTGLK